MNELSDEALMIQVQKGQSEALGPLIFRYEKRLFGLAMRILGNAAAAEDTFQETFLRVYQKRLSYRPGSPFRPWVYRICLNLCRDLCRSRQRRPQSELSQELRDPQLGPQEKAEQSLLAARVAEAVAELPEKQREVFLLSFYQQLSQAEVAEILEIPIGTVKSRLFHASRTLADKLRDYQSP